MRVGLVSPYSLDVPGGVQRHVLDLAVSLRTRGHEVNVLAPCSDPGEAPDGVTAAGRAVPVRYNGSVARLALGTAVSARTTRWLDEGDFDLVHVHEPMVPSVSLLALRAARCPVVATFHTSGTRSRTLQTMHAVVAPAVERITARIAVSEAARTTMRANLGGDAIVIPNGVDVSRFATALPRPEWQGWPAQPTVGFLGRFTEPRKGFAVLLDAWDQVLQDVPGARLLVAGPGSPPEPGDRGRDELGVSRPRHAGVEFLGELDEADKATFLRSLDVYVAPNTGGESFGIILLEALAAGAPVVASDLDAFVQVIGDTTSSRLSAVGDAAALAASIVATVTSPDSRRSARVEGPRRAAEFDWSTVTDQVLGVYDAALAARTQAVPTSWVSRVRRRLRT